MLTANKNLIFKVDQEDLSQILKKEPKNRSSGKMKSSQSAQIEQKYHGKISLLTLGQEIDLANVLEDYKNIFQVQTKLFSYLNAAQAFYIRAEELRHPLIFYYGHPLTTYINKFVESGALSQRVNQRLETMLAIGVDQMDWDDLDQKHYDWPELQEVTQYRLQANLIIIQMIESLKDKHVSTNGLIWDILMSMEHHRVHIQTSAAIIRRVPTFYIKQVPQFKECPIVQNNSSKISSNQMIKINSYNFDWKFNKNHIPTYLFDNQIGEAKSSIDAFQISKFQISNGQFLEFVKSKGYQIKQYWTSQGQAWLKSKQRKHPIHWYKDQNMEIKNPQQDQIYQLRTMSKLIKMPWNWPVEVNHLEAEAFCKWKSIKQGKNYRLPTQQEFFAARDQNIPNINQFPFIQGNYNRFHWFSPCPVDLFRHGEIYNIVGNVWDHTRTPFHPFSGFKMQSNFDDYSAPYFGNRHSLLFGGSFASGLKEAYATRNWFRHHFYNFVGFRYTLSTNQNISYVKNQQIQFFDIDEEIAQQIESNYFSDISYVFLANQWLKKNQYFLKQIKNPRVLVIGGSVGRLSLQYSQISNEVYGIDYSAKSFKFASKFLSQGYIKSFTGKTLRLEQIKKVSKNNLHFLISNPQNPDFKKLNQFNIILVDGKGLKAKRLTKVLKHITQLKCKNQATRLIVITSKIKQNLLPADFQFDNKILSHTLKDQEDQVEINVFQI